MSTKVEIFVDYVCPFCFLVEEAVAELQRDREVEVVIRSFESRPNPVPTLKPDNYLPRIWNGSVYPMARRLGVDINLPTVSPQPRTARAFTVLQLANEHGVGQEYSTAIFRAFFEQNRDIGEDEVILDAATSVGLDRADAFQALESRERRSQQLADQEYAVDSVGVTAVPSVRVNGRLYAGVLDADRLKRAVDDATGREPLP